MPLDRVQQSTDLGRVQVDANLANWELMSDLSLPVNASSIINIVPGNLLVGTGYFCLYTIQSEYLNSNLKGKMRRLANAVVQTPRN